MAGKTIPEIYCWVMSIEDLNIYLASTVSGALRIALSLEEQQDCVSFFKTLFPNARLFEDYSLNRPLIQEARAALRNRPASGKLDLGFNYTSFQWIVLKAVAGIPFGETRKYGEMASAIKRPKAARAVGQALGRNPLPLIFP